MPRFVWPPKRPNEPPEPDRPDAPAGPAPTDTEFEAARARPRSEPPPTTCNAAGAKAPHPHDPRSDAGPGLGEEYPLLIQIERAWLGLVEPPAEVRAGARGWSPDDAGDYCPRCASTRVPGDRTDDGACPACRGKALAWARATRLGAFHGLLRSLVHDVKFERQHRTGLWLGSRLGEAIRAQAGRGMEGWMVVPVSTTFRRRLGRGIDHSMAIARGLAGATGARLMPVLARKHRPEQTGLSASARARNVVGTFRLRAGVRVDGWRVVLVDDVRTTGATLTAAARALGGAETIWVATVGVSEGQKFNRNGAAA